MVGGAPVTQAFADELGADGYGANAGMAVDRAKGAGAADGRRPQIGHDITARRTPPRHTRG